MQNKPLLSISILVSNRIDTIRNCMESIKPILEGIPSELVVVDTVGEATDGSIDIVREYTDKIYRFEWCNDFAKARNFGLERCSGEWFMFMDDDEWFEDVTEIVDFFSKGEYRNYNSATYKIHSYGSKEGAYALGTLFRMVKMTKNTQFVGRVHEYLSPLKAPAKEFSAYIHHYGYVFDSPEEERAHCERNLRLLEPDFEKDPWNMHVRVQLVQECMFLEELRDRAKQLCEETWEADKIYYKTNEFQWILLASLRMANKEDDYEKIVELAEMMRKRFPLSAMADLAISTIELNARCKLKQYEVGAAIVEHALKRREYLLENPEIKNYLNILDFSTFLDDSVYCELLRSGVRCYTNIGRTERAAELSKERQKRVKSPILSVSVLVSNRIGSIRKCLESVKPLLEAVPSELIIVDTVGVEQSDGSLEIAKEYTNHIVPFVWCDDFAAARNAGLYAAKGEWFLYLDDDEWFEDVSELITFFSCGEYLEYNSATYMARNYKDLQGNAYSDDVVVRMIRMGKNTEFIGCINESFMNVYLPNKAFSTYVHHFGFAYATEEEKKTRLQYTYRLLRKDLEKYPQNLRNMAQLGAVLSVDNPDEAVDVCLQTLEVCKERKTNTQYQWQFVVLYGLLERLQKFQIAEEKYRLWQSEELMSPFAEQVVCYRLTRMLILQERYAEAYLYAKRYFDLVDAIASTEVPKEFERYQDGSCKEEMLSLGAFCAWQAKAYADAWKYYECIPWEMQDASIEDSMWKLFALAEEYVDEQILLCIINRIMENVVLKPVLGKMMQENIQVKHRINNLLESQKKKATLVNGIEPQKILSVGILVSNRKDTIRKCMESLKPLLNAVSSELIALDTVGENTDGSVQIVREYTNQVYSYVWCNDFAHARNTCLSHATGEWFMFVDDDEWFEDVSELITFFESSEYKNYNSATYQIRNYKDLAGKEYSTAVLGRMVRLEPNTKFIGRIHETFAEFRLPCKEFSTYVHHYGYAYASEEDKQEHLKRNLELLQEEFEKHPKDLRIRTQMALELANFDNVAALEFCEETFRLCFHQKNSGEFQWQMSLVFCLYEALGTECDVVEQRYRDLRQTYGFTEMAENAIAYQITRICLIKNEISRALPHIRTYFKTYCFLQENKSAAQLQMSVDFARYQTLIAYQEMLQFGAFCAWQEKQYQESWGYFECMAWETLDESVEEYLWKMFALAEEACDGQAIYRIVKRIMTNERLKSVLGKLMQHPPIKKIISDALTQQKKAVVQPKIQNVTDEQDVLPEDLTLEEFQVRIAVKYTLQNMQQNASYWDELLNKLQKTQPVKYSYLLCFLAEKELQRIAEGPGKIGEWFEQYILTERRYFELLYRRECFEAEVVLWLPAEVRSNNVLYQFLCNGKKELRMLIEAAKLRPAMAQLIKRWLGELA